MMGVRRGSVEVSPAGQLGSEKRRHASGRNRKSKKSGPATSASPLQRLFYVCKEGFANCGAGIVPSQENIDRITAALDDIDAVDVGLSENMSYFQHSGPRRVPPITYLHLYESDKFSMGIFCLPPGGVIPLHNHPGMTVFSKLLLGSMHIKSYDWVDVPQTSSEIISPSNLKALRLAKLKTDAVFLAPCKTSVLYPSDGGNMHCFTSVTACAVLDVLGPPYSLPEEGRDCTYYNDFPYAHVSGGFGMVNNDDATYVWLEERRRPEDLAVIGAKYRGPKFSVN